MREGSSVSARITLSSDASVITLAPTRAPWFRSTDRIVPVSLVAMAWRNAKSAERIPAPCSSRAWFCVRSCLNTRSPCSSSWSIVWRAICEFAWITRNAPSALHEHQQRHEEQHDARAEAAQLDKGGALLAAGHQYFSRSRGGLYLALRGAASTVKLMERTAAESSETLTGARASRSRGCHAWTS